jgi:hypothetical protein
MGDIRGLKVPPRASRRRKTHRPPPSADYYREKAREITSVAWRSRSVEVRLELFEIAELFERMADRMEKRLGLAAD